MLLLNIFELLIWFCVRIYAVKTWLLSYYLLHYYSPMVLWEVYNCLNHLLCNALTTDISYVH